MTPAKRAFDIIMALVILAIMAIPAAFIAAYLLACQGRPIVFRSERMKTPSQSFLLLKFRTMLPATADEGVSGGNKTTRITKAGRFLRRTRLDEVPQLWNILRGDISFVGPRPPLRIYVERFPQLYTKVLQNRPGVTGLATLVVYKREERLLAKCTTSAETDAVYSGRCVPLKARVDLIYQQKQTLLLDIIILARTISRLSTQQKSA